MQHTARQPILKPAGEAAPDIKVFLFLFLQKKKILLLSSQNRQSAPHPLTFAQSTPICDKPGVAG
jgi:hypothetical protein